MGAVVQLEQWELIQYGWCQVVKSCRRGQVTNLIFPDGQELDVEKWNIVIHDNGIEFID